MLGVQALLFLRKAVIVSALRTIGFRPGNPEAGLNTEHSMLQHVTNPRKKYSTHLLKQFTA